MNGQTALNMNYLKAGYGISTYTGGSFKTYHPQYAIKIANSVYTLNIVTKLVQKGIGYLSEFAENLTIDAEKIGRWSCSRRRRYGIYRYITPILFHQAGGYVRLVNATRTPVYGMLDSPFQDHPQP